MAKRFQVLMIIALAPSLAIAQLGSGNTTLPVGNFGARIRLGDPARESATR